MNGKQRRIESIHQRLMDLRDSTPTRRGSITAENNYVKIYRRAYKHSRLGEFFAAAEAYRQFLQSEKP